MTSHTSKEFEHELRELRERLLAMGGRAEQQITAAIRALTERDDQQAQQVIKRDDEVDRYEVEIDELAQNILATRQPVASDLRFITMSLKIVTDLERIGDLAANIAKRALELNKLPIHSADIDLRPLAASVERNLRDALDSFVTRDAEKAEQVIKADYQIDLLNAQVFEQLISRVAAEPSSAARVIPLTSVARSCERIGDHAKNLAEEVLYMVRGRDVRHGRAR